jgi:rare lipoprotein A (peptidoglycan hydrolase)
LIGLICAASWGVEIAAAAPFVPKRVVYAQQGLASWYGPGFHGKRTANGERFDQHEMTAAHRYLPLGTKATVTNLDSGRSVVVRINDRGPFAHRRIIDLSRGAAEQLGIKGAGVGLVRIEVPARDDDDALAERDEREEVPYDDHAEQAPDGFERQVLFDDSDGSLRGTPGDI